MCNDQLNFWTPEFRFSWWGTYLSYQIFDCVLKFVWACGHFRSMQWHQKIWIRLLSDQKDFYATWWNQPLEKYLSWSLILQRCLFGWPIIIENAIVKWSVGMLCMTFCGVEWQDALTYLMVQQLMQYWSNWTHIGHELHQHSVANLCFWCPGFGGAESYHGSICRFVHIMWLRLLWHNSRWLALLAWLPSYRTPVLAIVFIGIIN